MGISSKKSTRTVNLNVHYHRIFLCIFKKNIQIQIKSFTKDLLHRISFHVKTVLKCVKKIKFGHFKILLKTFLYLSTSLAKLTKSIKKKTSGFSRKYEVVHRKT